MPTPVVEPSFRLAVYAGDDVVVHELPASGRFSIGRAPENAIVIDHRSVSRQHAVLHVGPGLRIEDLGGANGTYVLDGREPTDVSATQGVRQISRTTIDVALGEPITLGSATIVVRRHLSDEALGKTGEWVVRDPVMKEVYEQAHLAAEAPISLLLLGETGVGKEVLAREIHRRSPRSAKTFLGVNCGALSDSLLESELFGHEKGAFTGALHARAGLFEAADGGTVFLDEVGELPAAAQVKLLRVLEAREVMRVGGRSPVRVDVRIIAATHRDLERDIESGRFRQDLFFRINGLSLTVPPLRERRAEIEPLAAHFLAAYCRAIDRARPPSISAEAMQILEAYDFPGNLRELKNVLERAVTLCRGDQILASHLPVKLAHGSVPSRAPSAPAPRLAAEVATPPEAPQVAASPKDEAWEHERRRVIEALEECAGNQTRAAKVLGVSRRTLVARIAQFGIPRPRAKADE